MAGIKYARFGDYMQATAGGTDSAASSSYGTPTYSSSSSSSNQGNQGAGQSAPSAAPSADEIANTKSIKQKLRDSLEGIVASQGQPGFETTGIAGQNITGQNKEGQNVSLVIPANVPPKFHQFLINNAGTQAAASILNNYAASGVNPYQQQIQDFKDTPGGLAVFKERFPNPLIKIGQGIGNFFKEGTLLGKFLSNLSKSDQNKLKTITNDPQGVKQGPPAYDVNQYGLGGFYQDKIYRDLIKQAQQNTLSPYGIPDPGAEASEAGITSLSPDLAYKKKIVDKFFGSNNITNDRPDLIQKAYNYVMKVKKNDNVLPSETNMMGTSSPDFSNFQEQIVDEVTEKNVPGANEDDMMDSENIFELGSSNLAGSVSETDYTAPNISGSSPVGEVSSARPQGMLAQDPNINYGQETNILDVLAEDNMANGGYMKSFPNQNLNIESLSASDNIDDRIMKNLQFEKMSPGMMGYNQGGKVMSTYDKLKAIADNNYG